jgi:hypothetical protein
MQFVDPAQKDKAALPAPRQRRQHGGATHISAPNSAVEVLVIATDKEVARRTQTAIAKAGS